MSKIATIENMRKYYEPGVSASSPETGEIYSANPADYWDAEAGFTMYDLNGQPLLLCREEIRRVWL